MTNPMETLDPRAELARAFAITPPARGTIPLWKVVVDIGLDGGNSNADVYPLSYVGAYDLTRRGALQRGAGEAVERFAIAQRGQHPEASSARLSDLNSHVRSDRSAEYWWPWWVDQRRWRECELTWYPAIDLESGRTVRVPAHAVDYDGAVSHRHSAGHGDDFDPSPSGAASGATREDAVLAAVLELIERDAVQCAWAGLMNVELISNHQLLNDLPANAGTGRLLRAALSTGLRPVLGRVTPAVAGVAVVVCVIVDRGGDRTVGATGSKASPVVADSIRGALQEALQVHELLTNLTNCRYAPTTIEVTDDVARAWWWTRAENVDELDAFSSRFRPSTNLRAPAAMTTNLRSVVRNLAEDGTRVLVVDLDHRLPAAVSALGWHAVKAICPGYQQLRMDHTNDGTINTVRFDILSARRGQDRPVLRLSPHPLI